jgi:hypothetical protein
MFWGVSRLILTTSGATSPMFLECFGGSPDYFQWLFEQLYQFFSSVFGSPQTISNDFRSNYTNVSQVFWGVPKAFPLTFGATISMFLKYFGSFQSNYINVARVFRGVPRLFWMTFGATIPMFHECLRGPQDYVWRLPVEIYSCRSIVLGGCGDLPSILSSFSQRIFRNAAQVINTPMKIA